MQPRHKELAPRKSFIQSAAVQNAQAAASFAQALTHTRQGQWAQAQALYREVLKLAPGHYNALYLLGIIAAQCGNDRQAVTLFDEAITLFAHNAAFHSSRGISLKLLKRMDEALLSFNKAIQLEPGIADTHYHRGATLMALNRPEEALASFDAAIALFAQDAAFHSDRGLALLGLQRLEEALASFNQAAQLEPHVANRHYNRGVTLTALKRWDEALASYDQAIRLNPGFADAYNNRGLILHALKRWDEALASFERTLAINPEYAGGYFNHGNVLLELKRLDEARASFERALAINPEYAEAHSNRGNALRQIKHLDAALESHDRALQLKPDLVEAHINRGVVLDEMGQHSAALESLARAIAMKPDYACSYAALADLHHKQGDIHAAVKGYRQALSLDPTMTDAHSALIFQLDLLPGPGTAAQQQERRLWNQRHAEPLMQVRDYANTADPQRRLRIGYVSGDFKNHSAASAFKILLEDFDRTSFEVIAYSNTRLIDEMTSAMQSQVTLWRDICNLSDEAAADLMVGDRIDLLVDLSGHTAGNRLRVFARSPAPVQVSAIGYPTGTGMRAMDAVLSDAVVIPPEERHLYAEEVRYLPSVLIYSRNLDDFPSVNELPALSSKVLTFGSFNRLSKITEESLTLWAYLLQVLPQTELLLKASQLDDQAVRQWLMAPFTKAGIAPERIRILGATSWVEHMQALNQVDIALDTLPHGGGITTLESIAMGVPVISLRWPTFTGRTSASILTTLALTDWIAENIDGYLQIAIEKSRDIHALAVLRARLRPRFAASHFGDSAAALKTFENEYRKLWQEWCARRSAVVDLPL